MKKNLFLILSLLLCVSVFGQNHWTPDESLYPNTMSVNAVITFDNIEQKDVNYEIGVFCGEELRGSQTAQYLPSLDRCYFFLTVYGEDGDALTFKLYDHKLQQEMDYESETELTFVSQTEVGSIDNPFKINFRTSAGNHWVVDETLYSSTMTVIAVVAFNGDEQNRENYEIGVFCGDEVRGSQRTQYIADFDRCYLFLNIYGEDNDVLTFKIYDHELKMELDYSTETAITFKSDDVVGTMSDPLMIDFVSPIKIYTFVGEGSWYDAANWKNNKMPELETDNVIIDGDASLLEGSKASANSLLINNGKSLTIQNNAMLMITSSITNTDVDALVIEDGGQLLQSSDDVAATFKKNIVNPNGMWGEADQTGWQFISSPMYDFLVSDFIPSNGDYDLYKYDGTLKNQWYNYKQTVTYSFDDKETGWESLDNDGDDFDWFWNNGCYYSVSYDEGSGAGLSPDNYLMSPKTMIEEGMMFKFKVRAGDDKYMEFCGVSVSRNGVDFELVEEGWWIGNGEIEGYPSEWVEKVVSLNKYAGEELFVAIRHYNVTDAYCLMVDDAVFSREGATFESGRAYLASYSDETAAWFKGVLYNENSCKINVKYDMNNDDWNYYLIGNPFSYNLDWAKDVQLVGVSNGYAVVKEDGAYEYHDNGIIKVGEGFMIHSSAAKNHNITMQKGVCNPSKNENEPYSINIIASGKTGSDNVIINFTDNNDGGFPKLRNFNDNVALVYVRHADTVYAISNYDTDVKEIPVHFDAKEMGSYTLSFDVEGDFENLVLLDRMTGEKINLLLENEYSFIAASDDNTDRFILSLADSQQPTVDSDFAYINNGNLIVNAEGLVQIIDIMGRVVIAEENHNGIINISSLKDAAYIVRCVSENDVKTQKIVVL